MKAGLGTSLDLDLDLVLDLDLDLDLDLSLGPQIPVSQILIILHIFQSNGRMNRYILEYLK